LAWDVGLSGWAQDESGAAVIELNVCPEHGDQEGWSYCTRCDRATPPVRYFSLSEIKALLTEPGPVQAALHSLNFEPQYNQEVEWALADAVDALSDAIPSKEKT
jgi:hypothetical protein